MIDQTKFYIVRDDGKFYRRKVSVVFGSPVLAKAFATAEEATRELALINPPALRRRCTVQDYSYFLTYFV